MSHIGKLSRGLKWYEQRTADGLPSDIADDPLKMEEVDYFINFCKGKDMKKIAEDLSTLKYIQRNVVKGKAKLIEDINKRLSEAKK